MNRPDDLRRLYRIFDTLEAVPGGKRFLTRLPPSAISPRRGLYFFFEPRGSFAPAAVGPRIMQIGTHALGAGSRSTLRQRLRQHAGNTSGSGGNHRGSISVFSSARH